MVELLRSHLEAVCLDVFLGEVLLEVAILWIPLLLPSSLFYQFRTGYMEASLASEKEERRQTLKDKFCLSDARSRPYLSLPVGHMPPARHTTRLREALRQRLLPDRPWKPCSCGIGPCCWVHHGRTLHSKRYSKDVATHISCYCLARQEVL